MTDYCDDEAKCRNRAQDCEYCTRSYYYEESSDCFEEIYGEEDTKKHLSKYDRWKEHSEGGPKK